MGIISRGYQGPMGGRATGVYILVYLAHGVYRHHGIIPSPIGPIPYPQYPPRYPWILIHIHWEPYPGGRLRAGRGCIGYIEVLVPYPLGTAVRLSPWPAGHPPIPYILYCTL